MTAAPGALGGAAADSGIQYQRGVAAYIAAHALAGRRPPGLHLPADASRISAIAMETNNAVDDIRIDYDSGARVLIQAKSRMHAGKVFTDAVGQWAQQVRAGLDPDTDRLVIVCGELSGTVRDVRTVLKRAKAATPAAPTKAQTQARTRLRDALADLTDAEFDVVLRCGAIHQLAVEDADDPAAREARLLLEMVVAAPDAARAWSTLVDTAGRGARLRVGFTTDQWLRSLAEAGVPLRPSEDTAAADLMHSEQVVGRYLQRLRDNGAQVDLRLLDAAVPPISIDALGGPLSVNIDLSGDQTAALVWLALRRGRMLLTGLPGSGKSTALRRCAADLTMIEAAPLPVLAALSSMYADGRRGPFRQRLVDVVVEQAPVADQPTLRRIIDARITSGGVMLLLDALDETYSSRGAAIHDLEEMLRNEASPDVDVLLSTRDSAYAHAATLHWPVARLRPPEDVGDLVDPLIEHCAATIAPESGRDEWIATRKRWVHHAIGVGPAVKETPLLPTLLVMLAVESDHNDDLPESRAQILFDVVRAAVSRHRPHAVALKALPDANRVDALLEAFAVEAHTLLDAEGSATKRAILDRVSAMLSERWNVPAGMARSAASETMNFWDENGIFVVQTGTALVTPRVTLFAEVGDAVYATRIADDEAEWINSRCSAGASEPVTLAAGMSPAAGEALVAHIERTRDAVMARAAAQTMRTGVRFNAAAVQVLRQVLADDMTKADDESWRSFGQLIDLPDKHLAAQLVRANSIAFPAPHQTVVRAWADLTDRPDNELVADPQSLLPVLDITHLEHLPTRDLTAPIREQFFLAVLGGDFLRTVTNQIAHLLVPAVPEAAQRLLARAHAPESTLSGEVQQVLTDAGYRIEPDPKLLAQVQRAIKTFQTLPPYDDAHHLTFINLVAGVNAGVEVPLDHVGSNRMTELADLLATLRMSMWSAWHLAKYPEIVERVVPLVAALAGLDEARVAAQARLTAHRMRDSDPAEVFHALLVDAHAHRDLSVNWGRITPTAADVAAIDRLFRLGRDSAFVAAFMLWQAPAHVADIAAPLLRKTLRRPWKERSRLRLPARTLASLPGHPEPGVWIDDPDPGLRALLASWIDTASADSGVVERLLDDRDGGVQLSVLGRIGAQQTAPIYADTLRRLADADDPPWQCPDCATNNPATAMVCTGEDCHTHAPEPWAYAQALLDDEPPHLSVHDGSWSIGTRFTERRRKD